MKEKGSDNCHPISVLPPSGKFDKFDCITELLVGSASYLYETRDTASAIQDKYWQGFSQTTTEYLEKYCNILNAETCRDIKSASFASLDRHQVRLKFILQLLKKEQESGHKQSSPSLLMEYRQSLVYVLHESVRYLSNKEVQFLTRPLKFTKCLVLLIRYHAEYFIGVHLPTALTDIIKNAIVTNELSERQTEIENIQHSTDLYMMGFVLLNTSLEQCESKSGCKDDRRTVIEYISSLSANKEKQAIDNFAQAFAIAAVFHDISILPACRAIDETEAQEYLIDHVIPKEAERRYFASWL